MLKDRVLKTYYKNNPNWIIAISANGDIKEKEDMKKIKNINMTFVVLKANYYVEWIPIYGPITVIEKSENKEDNEDYIFNYNKGRGGWTQSACDRLELNNMFLEGKYEEIFKILEEFEL